MAQIIRNMYQADQIKSSRTNQAEHVSCMAQMKQNMYHAWHKSCITCIMHGTNHAEHVSCMAQIMQNMYHAWHKSCRTCVMHGTY